MSLLFQQCLAYVMNGQTLTAEQMHAVVSEMMTGDSDPLQTAGLLCVMSAREETAEEFTGAARAMRERATLIRQDGTDLLDTCGTGGSGLKTFNVSTAAAIVCAAAGVRVAKHGNRSITSTSGSADVLEQLGVKIELTPEQVNQCLDHVGIGFCFAPLLHLAMKNVGPIRKALGVRTIFNMLGPLTNPARAEYQLLGTIRTRYAEKLAGALAQLGTKRSVVLCGNNELDEISLWGPTELFVVADGTVQQQTIHPAELGLPTCTLADIQVDSAAESADLIRRIFQGDTVPARAMVIANAAAGLWVTGRTSSIQAGIPLVTDIIQSGQAASQLERLREFSQQLRTG